MYLRLIIFSISLLIAGNTYGQRKIRKLKVEISTPHRELWEEIDFENEDTAFSKWYTNNWYSKRAMIRDIPAGKYTARIWSVFNDSVEQKVTVKRWRGLKFSLEDYYKIDTSSVSFFDRMKNGDTLRMYSIAMSDGRFLSVTKGYCAIILQANGYQIRFHSDSGGYTQYALSENDLNRFREIEKSLLRNGDGLPQQFIDCNRFVFYAYRLGRQVKKMRTGGRTSYIETLFDKMVLGKE
jgi:hypothetical protein